jgi:acetyltransferase-like isoleucine patch superfamily enzyme
MKFTFVRFLMSSLREAYADCYGRLAIDGDGRVHRLARIYRQAWCPIRIGPGSLVDAFATLYCANSTDRKEADNSEIMIGSNTFIGSYTDVRAGDGRIEIGDDTLIAQHVSLIAAGHGLDPDTLIRLQPAPESRGIVIGSDVWIGAGARILPGVRIGDHAVVGAGAVVTKDVEPSAIVVGTPARLLRYRGQDA